jgi:hypothetical protein
MYKVIDVAKMFSVSKVTIYKKISAKKTPLKGHIIKKKNITYLDDEAVEIIRNSLQVNHEKASGRLIDEELNQTYLDLRGYKEQNEKLKAEKIALLNDQLVDLESTVRYLNSQVALKTGYLNKQEEIIFDINEAIKHQKYVINQLESFISAQELEGKY